MVSRLQRPGRASRVRRRAAASRRAARWAGRTSPARSCARAAPSTSRDAFDRYIGRGRPGLRGQGAARVPRGRGPGARGAAAWSRVAHLKERGTRAFLERLKREGLDAVETRHPSHDADLRVAAHRHRPAARPAPHRRQRLARRSRAGRDPRRPRLAGGAARVAGAPGSSCGPVRPRRSSRERSDRRRAPSAPEFSAEASDGRTYALRDLLADSRGAAGVLSRATTPPAEIANCPPCATTCPSTSATRRPAVRRESGVRREPRGLRRAARAARFRCCRIRGSASRAALRRGPAGRSVDRALGRA